MIVHNDFRKLAVWFCVTWCIVRLDAIFFNDKQTEREGDLRVCNSPALAPSPSSRAPYATIEARDHLSRSTNRGSFQGGSKASRKHDKGDRSASLDTSKRAALEEMVQSYKEREERATGEAKRLRGEARDAKLKNRALFDRYGGWAGVGSSLKGEQMKTVFPDKRCTMNKNSPERPSLRDVLPSFIDWCFFSPTPSVLPPPSSSLIHTLFSDESVVPAATNSPPSFIYALPLV